MPAFLAGIRQAATVVAADPASTSSIAAASTAVNLRGNIAALEPQPGDTAVAGDLHETSLVSNAADAAAPASNAELIASLPPGQLDAFLPDASGIAPQVPVRSKFEKSMTTLMLFPWRDTPHGGVAYGGELVRRESLKKSAVGGAHESDPQVTMGPGVVAHGLAGKARQAGLSAAEAAQLESILRDGGSLDTDAPIVKMLLQSENAARALRTFIDLDPLRRANPDRITPTILQSLTLGVGRARTQASEGREGILGNDTALAAARALVAMRPEDYTQIGLALGYAANDNGFAKGLNADAQTERALILKAVAAREEGLSHNNLAEYFGDQPSSACREIIRFSGQIRGLNAKVLIERTSGIDLDGDGVDEAVQQKWQNASAPAVLQMLRAEADPVYAWGLHNDMLNNNPAWDFVADTQAVLISDAGGKAIDRGSAPGGPGDLVVPAMAADALPFADMSLERQAVTLSGRASAVDHIELLVANGVDVPIAVSETPGYRRALLITDVRGTGNSRQFLVTDPWNGRTEWVSRADIANGNIGGAGGILTDYWYKT